MQRKFIQTTLVAALSFAAGTLLGPHLVQPVLAQLPVRQVTTTNLMHMDLGDFCAGKEIVVQINEFGPGTSRKHYHPGHSFGWILSGSEETIIEGQRTTGKTGDLRHDGPMQVHEAITVGPEKVILFRIMEKGKPLTTYVE